jgi:dTMP kinase
MTYHIEFDIDLRRNEYPGLFIALEGIDASGKSTQVKKLQEAFAKDGKPVIIKHPFEGELGRFIRRILAGETKVSTVALQYLISANRHVQQEEIVKQLKNGLHVIIDRYVWSAVVYGIFDKGGKDYRKNANWLLLEQSILSMYHQFLMPDFTFFLSISPETAIKRLSLMQKTHEIYEDAEKIKAITDIYNFIVKEYKNEFIVIDGERSVEEITQEMMNIIRQSHKY